MKQGKRVLAIILSASCLATASPIVMQPATAADVQTAFYLSPEGSDSNDGSLDAPFQTLAKARDAVRTVNQDMKGDICVYLRGGTYRLGESVSFDTRDSGTNGYHIRYEAYKDETPIISGATQVTGWTVYKDNIYQAKLNRKTKLRNLYVNDTRAQMTSVRVNAQGGYGEYSITAGQASWAWDSGKKSDGAKYNASDIPAVTSNKDDLEIINGTTWNENIVCTRDVISQNGSTVMLFQQPYGSIAQTPGWGAGFSTSGTHTIYNAFSFMDAPGEFYFDKTTQTLYYWARSGENMANADVEAPFVEQLLVIAGESTKNRVKNLDFSGITFAHTDFMLTKVGDSYGKTTCQAAQSYTAFADSNWHSKRYEMADTLPAMIHITSSDTISFTGNIIKHSGADGLSMTNDVINSDVSGNYITDITSSGITVGHPQHIYIGDGNGSNREKFSPEVEGVCKNDTITNNLLYDISVVHGFGGCAAVTAYFADSVKILHNTIKKTAYNGIHLGWGWCNFKDSTTCRDNMICNNRVIDCLNRLHDSGGIYTIGQMPGTIINENFVQGIPAAAAYQPTYGLHNDEGTAYIEENDNVLEISPNVTYTINCEDYGQKHDLTILRTYATVCKMGVNPPTSTIDQPIVVSDNVWPHKQYTICEQSGIEESYRSIVPNGLFSESDYVFPASCAAKGGAKISVRTSKENTLWFAPDNTTQFVAGSAMTKAAGTAGAIDAPEDAGEYRLYVVDGSGKIVSKSQKLLRVSGSATQVDASSFSTQSGIELENCSEGGQDVAYIDNGDYVGYKDVDFKDGVKSIDIRVASNGAGGSIDIRLDSPTGTSIGTMDVSNTGGWQEWVTQTAALANTTGVHDMYFVFSGGEGSLFNLSWWKLNYLPVVEKVVPGDVNCDSTVDIGDVILLNRFLAEDADVTVTAQGMRNAECDGVAPLTSADAAAIMKFLAHIIDTLG